MDEKTSNVDSQGPQAQSHVQGPIENKEQKVNVTLDAPAQEHREAYGTAKTENLRDSGLWRILLPGFVVLCCLALLAIPLIILTPLFFNSLNSAAAANQIHEPITWLWVVMTIIVVTIAVTVIRGFVKIFMTSAGNYS